MDRPSKVAVIGLGNVLRRDDGVGPFAVRVLETLYEVPTDTEVLDLGTPGPEFAGYLLGFDAVVAVDAVSSGAAAGTVETYERESIVATPPAERLSPHDPSLREALLTAELAGAGPSRVALVGVVPASTELGTELTPVVRDALPAAVEAVVDRLAELGVECRRRTRPLTPDIWWERVTTGGGR